MNSKLSLLTIFILIQSSQIALALDVDLTGTWTSKYQFGPIEEVMTANIQHFGANLLGSFTVKPSEGDEYSGIIFGTVEGNAVAANYLSVRNSGDADPQVAIIFIDSQIVDQDTLRGTYYVQDSEMNAISGPFEATRK
ncbi:MAG: hypothetical protein E4G89_06065 [Methanothrix sp.]|nr:MAG: hypothetical protein E4G89_06065 [Methanothrix sp.]